MRTLQFALVAACLCALGCRSNNTQVLVEQEARMLEDEVYNLEAQLDSCCREKESLKRENEDLKLQQGGGNGSSSGSQAAPAIEMPRSTATPSRQPEPKLEPPTIELPESSETPPSVEMPSGDKQPPAEGQPSSLSINRRLTGGLDRDGGGGDEGIMVMVEPRDAQGRLVKTPGAVSVVLMDPSQTGDAARVARWDFQAHEFGDHFKTSTFGRGLQYELEWPAAPPQNHDLLLFVRYIAADGTKVTSDAPLSVRLASDAPRQPSSRLKAEKSEGPRELSASEEDDDSRSRTRRNEPSPRQAQGGDAPAWRPYR